jgi:DnaK suppressor protein
MDETARNRYRRRLEELRAELDGHAAQSREARRPVRLDQQSVGRLSRMDALQQQAMARATQGRREQMQARIRAALTRLEEGEFGHCTECGEEISPARLDLDPTVPTCISCARG